MERSNFCWIFSGLVSALGGRGIGDSPHLGLEGDSRHRRVRPETLGFVMMLPFFGGGLWDGWRRRFGNPAVKSGAERNGSSGDVSVRSTVKAQKDRELYSFSIHSSH